MRPSTASVATGNSRTLMERALEDAQHNGELSLAGRKLKDLATTQNIKCNLIDTIRADLSKNRFAELPAQVCQFIFMEQLNCRENSLRTLPKEMSRLKCLSELDISRNSLVLLPEVVCQLPLRILRVTHNRLVSLPEQIGMMSTLSELDASSNMIATLPAQIGSLPSLRSLNLRNNQLASIPKELAQLQLVILNLSQNRLTSLPVEMTTMTTLQQLELSDNPLEIPPIQMCVRGIIHIFKCIERMNNHSSTSDNNGLTRDHIRSSLRKSSNTPENIYQTPRSGVSKPSVFEKSNFTPHKLDSTLVRESIPVSVAVSQTAITALNHAIVSAESVPKPEPVVRSIERLPDDNVPSRDGKTFSDVSDNTSGSSHNEEPLTVAPVERIIPVVVQSSNGNVSTPKKAGESLIPRKISPVTSGPTLSSPRRPVTNGSKLPPSNGKATNGQTPTKTPVEFKQKHENLLRSQRVAAERLLQEVSVDGPAIQKPPLARKDSAGTRSKPGTAGATQPRSASSGANGTSKDFNPQLTMRRQQDHAKEEAEKVAYLRKQLEQRLKITLPEDLLSALNDGVILCQFVNSIRPRSVVSVHVPSAVPNGPSKLTSAKARRNVENFLDACRRIGVADEYLCSCWSATVKEDEEAVEKRNLPVLEDHKPLDCLYQMVFELENGEPSELNVPKLTLRQRRDRLLAVTLIVPFLAFFYALVRYWPR